MSNATNDWDDTLEEQEAINELNRTSQGQPLHASNPTRATRPSAQPQKPKMTTTDNTALAPAPAALSEGEEMWKRAASLACADIIPKQFQGNAANVFVALDMAKRLGCGVMEIMQNTFVVHGTPGFSSKYIIGMANMKGPFTGPIHFEYTAGANPSVTASAIVRATGERVEMTADMAMAKAEGWSKNKKYQTMPQVMLSYRAGTLLVRLYCPEVLLGMQTTEELQDVHAARTINAEIVNSPVAQINAKIEPPVDPDNAPDDLNYEKAKTEPEKVEAAPDMDDSHSTLYGDE